MAIVRDNKTKDFFSNDPYAGISTGGVTGDPAIYSPGNSTVFEQGAWADRSNTVHIPEEGSVRIGDFVMSGKEFKTCMKMLHKMAMKECPEEFI